LAVRRPTAAEVQAAREILQRAPQGPLRTPPEIYARETVQLVEWPARFSTPVQCIRIGEMAIVALPGEPFCETGLAIKARSPFRTTLLVGMANDYAGYLPTEEQHALGGYETWRAKSSFLEVRAATVLQDTVLRLLAQLAS
jgi:neutral ceramidase